MILGTTGEGRAFIEGQLFIPLRDEVALARAAEIVNRGQVNPRQITVPVPRPVHPNLFEQQEG
jgi:hypothetical protein